MLNAFAITLETKQPFAEVVQKLADTLAAHKFTVLVTHDFQATFAKKGLEHGPYKMLEFCRAPAAKQLLDAEPKAGVLLPCRVAVYEKEGKVMVVAFRPTAITQVFPELDAKQLASEIEADIVKVLEEATGEKIVVE